MISLLALKSHPSKWITALMKPTAVPFRFMNAFMSRMRGPIHRDACDSQAHDPMRPLG
jgi:hypothetical protein